MYAHNVRTTQKVIKFCVAVADLLGTDIRFAPLAGLLQKELSRLKTVTDYIEGAKENSISIIAELEKVQQNYAVYTDKIFNLYKQYVDDLKKNTECDVPTLPSSEVEATSDKWLRRMKKCVEARPISYPQWRIEDGKLFKHVRCSYPGLREGAENWREVVAKSEQEKLLSKYHDEPTAGHLGIFKTYARISKLYYWPKLKADVARYVNKCKTCQAHKPEQKRPAGVMTRHPIVDKPWQMISTDIVGPLPRSTSGYSYVLVVADYFSKFVLFFPLRTANAASVVKNIEENVFLMFGVPSYVLCDNGSQFRSTLFRKMVASYKSKIIFNANYHPQSNPSERVNRVMKTMLASYIEENQRTWDKFLPKVACAIRTAVHEVTGLTPYFTNFGREMVLEGAKSNDLTDVDELTNVEFKNRDNLVTRSQNFQEIYSDIKRKLNAAYVKSKHYYDLRRRVATFQVGDAVWRKNYVLSNASRYFSAKLAPKFIGPFYVKRKVSYQTYELSDSSGESRGIWHAKDLKYHNTD